MSDPLTPADCDLRGLPFLPLDVVRLLDSDLFALSTGDEFKAAVALWCRSWNQVPAASLPDDDRILAHLSGAGARWKKVRAMALRGWIKCNDGRLYHPVVAEKAREAWEHRQSQRARAAKRWQRDDAVSGNASAPPTAAPVADATAHAAAYPTAMQGTGTVKGEGREERKEEPPPSVPPASAPPAASPNARGCRLPDDFEPDLGFASRLGLDAAAEWAKFRDYWAAQPGLKGRKTDWHATWRNWCRKAAEQRPRALGPSEKPRFRNGFVELLYDEAMARAPGDSDPFIDADPIPKDLLQ